MIYRVSLINGNDKIDFTLKAEVILTGGAFYSGKQNIMTTLSHSNGPSISWKFDRKMENDNEIVFYFSCLFSFWTPFDLFIENFYNFQVGQVDSQLTYVPVKSGKPHKLNFQVKVQNQNKEDLEYHLTYLKPSGEDLDLKLCFKRAKNDDRTVYENQVNIYN